MKMGQILANTSQLASAGAIKITPDGFYAVDRVPPAKLDTLSNNIF